jgi:D-psicose/D-tagatose/L-ribulose 3-epimerase
MNALKVCFSHIAWPPEAEDGMLNLLQSQGVSCLELAPVRAFGNPLTADEKSVKEKRDFYQERGFQISALQALLFGSENLHLFLDRESRERMKEWLIAVGRVAGWCGAEPMVFGSPKNRLKGELANGEAHAIASEFFREVGDACASFGSCIVLEANPEAYGADYCTRLRDAAELVEMADSPGFQLHVDAGGLAATGEEFASVMRQYRKLIKHFHASQLNLADWKEPHAVHREIAVCLREIDYQGAISVEMRAIEPFEQSVTEALDAVSSIYLV